jgi:Protein of unknown function (DUF3131)
MPRSIISRLLPFLGLTTALISTSCGLAVRSVDSVVQKVVHVGHIGRYGKLTTKELAWAKVAWKYIENNTVPKTGLVNSVDKVPTATLWHIADYLASLVSAHQLGLIDILEFDQRVSKLLDFLNTISLSSDELPNRVYNTQNGLMVNFSNQPADIGWSANEIGRLLTWMKITGHMYPQFREYFDKVVFRWNFCKVIDDCGILYAKGKGNKRTDPSQEGRLGYLQYASAGFSAWGFETRKSAAIAPFETTDVMGIQLRYDARDDRTSGELAPMLTMPHVLLGLEFGWHYPTISNSEKRAEEIGLRELAKNIFLTQEQRYLKQGVFTARTDHSLRDPPHFLYDSIFASGYPWNTLSEQGKPYPKLALVATRAVFGMWALWPGAYTDKLMTVIEALYGSDKGWFEGRYEMTGGYEDLLTLSTNSMVLESLLYKVKGKLYPSNERVGYFQHRLSDKFDPPRKCFSVERSSCKVTISPDGQSFMGTFR